MKTNHLIRLASVSDQPIWDHLVSHPLQSWAWGDFRASMGINVIRLIEETAGKPTSVYQLTFHKIPYTPWTIGYFPKGPAPHQAMINQLIKIGHQKNAIFIQIEPNTLCHCEESRLLVGTTRQSIRKIASSHHPLFAKYTFVLDLTKSEPDLLQNMHSKTRYNLKVAHKHDVKIRIDSSPDQFDQYLQLVQTTTQRQGFHAHNLDYHYKMWQTMHLAGIAKLCTASFKGTVLAAWIIFLWQDTIYYPYGASSRNNREVMAPTLLLWEIARWGKHQGFKKFDLWGALGPQPNPNDPWYGFHRFKAGFNPQLVEFIGSYDLVINPPLYQTYKIADTIRWKVLKI